MSDGGVTPTAESERFATDVVALTEKAGLVRDVHSVIWVRGPDAISFLDALISQSVEKAEEGSVTRSFLLTPQGKMRAFLWILKGRSEEVGLITQRSTEEMVVADLTRFRFRVDATIEMESRPVATIVGLEAEAALLASDVARPSTGWLATGGGLVATVPFPFGGPPRFVLVGDAGAAVATSAAVASIEAYEAVRVASGEPLGNVDFSEKTIAHELGAVNEWVDFTKGCYLGQELVARIDSRGHVNRTLRAVLAAEPIDLTAATLTTEGKDVGTVTSSAPNPQGSGTIGLAIIRHEIANGTTIEARLTDATATTVTVEPLPVIGASPSATAVLDT